MEQQESPPCTPPASTIKRDSRSPRARPSSPLSTPRPQPNTAAPTTASSSSPTQNQLSASEPTLRFPLPQGNRQLANWISASNPDIMRVISTDESGLSDSTYELVTGTDTESQDGNYAESINESVASFDLHRPDDTYSLAGTENTYDDESVAGEDAAFVQLPPDTEDDYTEDEEPHHTLILGQTNPAVPEVDGQEQQVLEPKLKPVPEPVLEAEPDHDHDQEPSSQPSLEYTRQNLSTPSIATPEASGIVEKPPSAVPTPADDGEEPRLGRLGNFLVMFSDWRRNLSQTERGLLYHLGAQVLLVLVVFLWTNNIAGLVWSPDTKTNAPHIPTAASSTAQKPLTTSSVTSGLLPVDTGSSDDWSFCAKKSEFYITKNQGDYVISAIPKIKYQCLAVAAQRGGVPIDFSSAPADNGILVGFPYNESFGIVTVKVKSKCRPKAHKTFEILFPERGIMEEALERARNIAHDISEGVLAVAQEAERRLEEASGKTTSASTSFLQHLSGRLHEAQLSLDTLRAQTLDRLEEVKEETSKRISDLAEDFLDRLPNYRDVQEVAQLNLLNAQLAAKIWWLSMTGSKEEHDEYKRKASVHYNAKLAQVKYAQRDRRYLRQFEQESWLHPEVWARLFREGRCRNSLNKGRGGTNECKYQA